MRYKTFGELRAGDEVYVVADNSVEIVTVQSAEIDEQTMFARMGDTEYSLPLDATSVSNDDDEMGDIYCDINKAIRRMQDECENAWYYYRSAYSSLDYLLEIKNQKKTKQ